MPQIGTTDMTHSAGRHSKGCAVPPLFPLTPHPQAQEPLSRGAHGQGVADGRLYLRRCWGIEPGTSLSGHRTFTAFCGGTAFLLSISSGEWTRLPAGSMRVGVTKINRRFLGLAAAGGAAIPAGSLLLPGVS